MASPATGSGKVVIITGGGRGIGAATVRMAVQRGYAVCFSYLRNDERASAVARETGATALKADVRLEADVVRLFDQAAALGELYGVVNNAGALEQQMRMDEMDVGRIERVMAANFTSTFLCCREAVRRMSTRYGGQGGAIVNVSSLASRFGAPNEYVDYAAAKAAVDTLTLGLAKEVATEGIRVNAVRPGAILTEIHADGGEPNRVDRVKAAVPMLRGGQPEEIAAAVLWLLSEEASYITGSLLDAAGGR